jgi:DNA-binding transcriptional MocR family regulator
VVGSDAFAVDANAPPALRVSLGAARNRAELAEGLRLLASALRVQAARRQIV